MQNKGETNLQLSQRRKYAFRVYSVSNSLPDWVIIQHLIIAFLSIGWGPPRGDIWDIGGMAEKKNDRGNNRSSFFKFCRLVFPWR